MDFKLELLKRATKVLFNGLKAKIQNPNYIKVFDQYIFAVKWLEKCNPDYRHLTENDWKEAMVDFKITLAKEIFALIESKIPFEQWGTGLPVEDFVEAFIYAISKASPEDPSLSTQASYLIKDIVTQSLSLLKTVKTEEAEELISKMTTLKNAVFEEANPKAIQALRDKKTNEITSNLIADLNRLAS